MGAETVTLHLPTAIVGPLITAAIISAVTSYWWLIRKTVQLTDIVKDLQHNQSTLTDKVEKVSEKVDQVTKGI
jgi:uncharacterized protein YlxW (UPF0749 family)